MKHHMVAGKCSKCNATYGEGYTEDGCNPHAKHGELRLVTVYSAREALDKTEDRGGSRHLGYFLREDDALAVSKGMGAMGYDTTPSKHLMATTDGITGYIVSSSGDKIRANTSAAEAKRTLALSKMSDDELEALGLTRSS